MKIRISLKYRIRIRMLAMRIRNTAYLFTSDEVAGLQGRLLQLAAVDISKCLLSCPGEILITSSCLLIACCASRRAALKTKKASAFKSYTVTIK
jgi:hypothetical protein